MSEISHSNFCAAMTLLLLRQVCYLGSSYGNLFGNAFEISSRFLPKLSSGFLHAIYWETPPKVSAGSHLLFVLLRRNYSEKCTRNNSGVFWELKKISLEIVRAISSELLVSYFQEFFDIFFSHICQEFLWEFVQNFHRQFLWELFKQLFHLFLRQFI